MKNPSVTRTVQSRHRHVNTGGVPRSSPAAFPSTSALFAQAHFSTWNSTSRRRTRRARRCCARHVVDFDVARRALQITFLPIASCDARRAVNTMPRRCRVTRRHATRRHFSPSPPRRCSQRRPGCENASARLHRQRVYTKRLAAVVSRLSFPSPGDSDGGLSRPPSMMG